VLTAQKTTISAADAAQAGGTPALPREWIDWEHRPFSRMKADGKPGGTALPSSL